MGAVEEEFLNIKAGYGGSALVVYMRIGKNASKVRNGKYKVLLSHGNDDRTNLDFDDSVPSRKVNNSFEESKAQTKKIAQQQLDSNMNALLAARAERNDEDGLDIENGIVEKKVNQSSSVVQASPIERFNFANYAHSSVNTTRERIQAPLPAQPISSSIPLPVVKPITLSTTSINQTQAPFNLSQPSSASSNQLKPLMSKPKFNELLREELINRLYMIK